MAIDIGEPMGPLATPGSVLFVGSGPALAQDNAGFYFEQGNNTVRTANAVGIANSENFAVSTGLGGPNNSSSGTAGNSGTVTLTTGMGGTSENGSTPGASGNLLVKTGTGGGTTSPSVTGGPAGHIILQPGNGGSGASAGLGGSTLVRASSAASDILRVQDSSGATTHVTVSGSGRIGAGTTSPAARLHLGAGSTTQAPLKFTAGTNLTSPSAGAMEWDGSKLFMTLTGGTRRALQYESEIANVLDFGAKGDGTTDDKAAFQAAVDALVNTGGVVWVPPGKVYALGSKVSIKSKYSIWIKSSMAGRLTGGGAGTTHADKGLIRPTANLDYIFEWDAPTGLIWANGGGGGVEGLNFTDWDPAAYPSPRTKAIEGAIRVHTFGQWFCINCTFEWLNGRAIRFDTTIYSQLRNVKVFGCGAFHKPPIDIDGGSIMSAAKVWQVNASEITYVDVTTEFNSTSGGDLQMFPSGAIGEYLAIGYPEPFGVLTFTNTSGTSGVDGKVKWEYWNGEESKWYSLAVYIDRTMNFTATGDRLHVAFSGAANWEKLSLNGSTELFYVRAKVDTTAYSTNPVYDSGFAASTGLVWWDRGFLESCQYDEIEQVVRVKVGCALQGSGLYFENSLGKQLDGMTPAEQCPFIDASEGGGMTLDQCTFNANEVSMVIVSAQRSSIRNSSFSSFLSGDTPHMVVNSTAQQSTFENLIISGGGLQNGRSVDIQAAYCQLSNLYMNTTGRLNVAGIECSLSNIYMYNPRAAAGTPGMEKYHIDLSFGSTLNGGFIDGFNSSPAHGIVARGSTVTGFRIRRLGTNANGIVSTSAADVITGNHVGELNLGAAFVYANGTNASGNTGFPKNTSDDDLDDIVTLNAESGSITTKYLDTAPGASYTLKLLNSLVLANSTQVVASWDYLGGGGGGTSGRPIIGYCATWASGQVLIELVNNHAVDSFNGKYKIHFKVLN